MGFWQGAALGNALDAGAAEGELISEIRENGRLRGRLNAEVNRNNQLITELNQLRTKLKDIGRDAVAFKTFEKSIQENNGSLLANSLKFALLAKTRPDLLAEDAPLNSRRKKNLEMIVWCEYLTMTAYANSFFSKETAVTLDILAGTINHGLFNNKPVAEKLREAANKTERGLKASCNGNPQEWFDSRFKELQIDAKFKAGESVPVSKSIQPTDPVLKEMNFGNVLDANIAGIVSLMV